MILLMSCAPNGEGGSSSTSWFLLLFLFFPLGVLGLMIYRFWTEPEDIVWTKDDIEEYNRRKAEEAGEEYVGQSYVPDVEAPVLTRKYQIIWLKVKNYFKDKKANKDLKIARQNSMDERIQEGMIGMSELGLTIEETIFPVETKALVAFGNNNGDKTEDIDWDNIDVDDYDVDALFKD